MGLCLCWVVLFCLFSLVVWWFKLSFMLVYDITRLFRVVGVWLLVLFVSY